MKKVFLIVPFVLVVILLKTAFNRHIYIPSALEADRTASRQAYLGEGLGKIYKNRFGVTFFNRIYPVLVKFESKFFSNLGSGLVFIPLYGFLVYLGFRQNSDEK